MSNKNQSNVYMLNVLTPHKASVAILPSWKHKLMHMCYSLKSY